VTKGNKKLANLPDHIKKPRVLQSSTAKKVVKVVEALERQKTVRVP
jgi:hypothetical protein